MGDQIRQEISELLTRGVVHDPGIGFITLTRVKVSADLQVARVFYTSMGDEKARVETARALGRATPFFRRHLGSRLHLRRVPEIEFRFDESIASQDRIEQILRDLHDEDARRASAAAGEPPEHATDQSASRDADQDADQDAAAGTGDRQDADHAHDRD